MAIYCMNGNTLLDSFSVDGITLAQDYATSGNHLIGYYEKQFYEFVKGYISENGLYINGSLVTQEEMIYYLLNRDNCKFHGKLKKSGKYLVDSQDNIVELRGIGTHHLTQYANLHTQKSLEALKYCGINCIRMSAYLKDHYFTYSDNKLGVGYLTHPNDITAEMDRIIDYCVDLGLYVIADWHVWSGGGETLDTSSAEVFFTHFASKYYNTPNVLYELCNEPFNNTLAEIVTHCKTLRTLIKSYVTNPVLITGLRSFTNGVTEMYNVLQAESIDDIFLSQHRYSGGASLSTFETWWDNGMPLFITEWSNTSASTGTQSEMNVTEGNAFLAFFHENKIPNCIWKFTDQTMAYATMTNRGYINAQYYKQGAFLQGDCSTYGHFFYDKYRTYAFTDHS